MRSIVLLFAMMYVVVPAQVIAGTISFESTPLGATPTDGAALTSSYAIDGVTVGFQVDLGLGPENLVFEQAGQLDPGGGFVNFGLGGLIDTPNVGLESQLGDWFLVAPGDPLSHTEIKLIITYSSISGPVTAASGEIWDIDGRSDGTFEQWRIEAFDGSSALLDTILSPVGIDDFTPLDGAPWTFAFDGLSDIQRIEATFIGNTPPGLAFNNFSPTTVPEPSTALLLMIGLTALGARRPHG